MVIFMSSKFHLSLGGSAAFVHHAEQHHLMSVFFFQTLLSKAKEELEAEKRDLVRTLERRSLEVEHLNGTVQ